MLIYYGMGVNMGELFLLSFSDLKNLISNEIVFLSCFIAVFILSVLCVVLSVSKTDDSLKKRLWIVLCFGGIALIEFWVEYFIIQKLRYLLLLIAIQLISLGVCLFVSKKEKVISDEKRSLASFLNKCALRQNYIKEQEKVNEDNALLTIKPPVQQDDNQNEIDFSHVKSVLKKLDYYPLKEQDKKSAKELENAINEAEQNGLDSRLKQSINDGLGLLLKIMSKYAI